MKIKFHVIFFFVILNLWMVLSFALKLSFVLLSRVIQAIADLASSKEVVLAPSKEVDLAPSKEVDLAPSKEVDLVPSKEVDLAPSKEVVLAPSKEVDLAPTKEVDLAPSKEVELGTSKEVELVPSKEVEFVTSKETFLDIHNKILSQARYLELRNILKEDCESDNIDYPTYTQLINNYVLYLKPKGDFPGSDRLAYILLVNNNKKKRVFAQMALKNYFRSLPPEVRLETVYYCLRELDNSILFYCVEDKIWDFCCSVLEWVNPSESLPPRELVDKAYDAVLAGEEVVELIPFIEDHFSAKSKE